MKFINKLERKFGKYAIHNLIFYIIILYAAGFLINMINPSFYNQFLMLDVEKVFRGQVWRLVTFMIQPPNSGNPFFLFFELYLYYMIGKSLENAWGAFRFNLYYFSGILFNILAILILYMATGFSFPLGLIYINRSMFFAFASLFPNMQFLLFFILPVKVKYLAYLYGGVFLLDVIQSFMSHNYHVGIAILISIGNFLIYFFNSRNYKRFSPHEIKRKKNYRKQVRGSGNVVEFNGRKKIARHKCAVCGRTELDDDDLEFRFCSKCDGNYEYCMDHLFTHEHVNK